MIQQHPVKVLCIDDQQIVGVALEELFQGKPDLYFHFCSSPSNALVEAEAYEPTVILLDLIMAEIDGMLLLKYLRASSKLRDVPIIVLSSKDDAHTKAEAFSLGANDYLVKFPEEPEFLARLRYHSMSYTHLLERNAALKELEKSQKRLSRELTAAAEFIRSQLPSPMHDREIAVDWRYIPASEVGGDAFGYRWLDTHFLIYLLDVTGHGIRAALHSATILHVLHKEIANSDPMLLEPALLLDMLNSEFQMEEYDETFFTLWYGVYNPKTRTLTYASAGHPPAFLLPEKRLLVTENPPIGIEGKATFLQNSCVLEKGSTLYLFSDGAYEVVKRSGAPYTLEEFTTLLSQPSLVGVEDCDRILNTIQHVTGKESFTDDFCLLQLKF